MIFYKNCNQFFVNQSLSEIRVEYKPINSDADIRDELEKKMEEIANEFGLEFSSSGFDFESEVRALQFTIKEE